MASQPNTHLLQFALMLQDLWPLHDNLIQRVRLRAKLLCLCLQVMTKVVKRRDVLPLLFRLDLPWPAVFASGHILNVHRREARSRHQRQRADISLRVKSVPGCVGFHQLVSQFRQRETHRSQDDIRMRNQLEILALEILIARSSCPNQTSPQGSSRDY